MSAAPPAMSRMNEHVSDVFRLVNKVSHAQDLQDVIGAHAAFVQKKVDMFNGRAQEIGDLLTAGANVVSAFASLLQLRASTEETAHTSPKYRRTDSPEFKSTDGDPRHSTWRAS